MGITIGTLSFARSGETFHIKAKDRVRQVLNITCQHGPTILLTAGHVIHTRKHLWRLAECLAALQSGTTIVTEVHYDGSPAKRLSDHALYAIGPDGSWRRLGRQVFAKREETIGNHQWRVPLLAKRAPERLVAVGDRSLFVLGCGEINAVQGREHARFIDPVIGAAIASADIVLNPTHDRMGRAGLLDAKRKFLSQASGDGRPRVYVSCSNWNLRHESGIAQYPSATIHTCYVSGQRVAPSYEEGGEERDFLYRAYHIP